MKRAVLQKNRLILNSKKIVNRRFTTREKKIKRSGIKAQETIEILPINIVIQT